MLTIGNPKKAKDNKIKNILVSHRDNHFEHFGVYFAYVYVKIMCIFFTKLTPHYIFDV